MDNKYKFTDNPMVSGVSQCNTDIVNDCLMHLKYENNNYLGERNISNCIKSAPQLCKWNLQDGVLTLEAGSIVRWAAGKEAPTLNIGDTYNDLPIVDISWNGTNLIYYTQTQKDYSWTYPTYTGSVQMFLQDNVGAEFWGLQTDMIESGNTPPSNPGNRNYYNTDNNTCLHLRDNIQQSFPIMEVYLQSGVGVVSVVEVYDTGGKMGSTIWFNKNVTVNLVDRLDNTCGLASEEYTTPFDTFLSAGSGFSRFNAILAFVHLEQSPDFLVLTTLANWNAKSNLVETTFSNSFTSYASRLIIGKNLTINNGLIQSYTPLMPFRAADAQEIDGRYIVAGTTLVSNLNIASNQTSTIDLSTLLPADGQIYEVIINIAAQTDATAGHTVNFYVSSDITPSMAIFRGRTSVANMNVNCGGNVKIPVGAVRQVVLRNSGTGTAMNISATTSGFRRIH